MQPERTALADEPVEQQRRFLRELVVLDEELLELVDDEQDARAGRLRRASTSSVSASSVISHRLDPAFVEIVAIFRQAFTPASRNSRRAP